MPFVQPIAYSRLGLQAEGPAATITEVGTRIGFRLPLSRNSYAKASTADLPSGTAGVPRPLRAGECLTPAPADAPDVQRRT